MSRRKNQIITAAGISLAAIIIDQIIKIWVKTNMYMHEVIDVTPWFKILFTENRGMAFGMELMDKLFLTSFRIFAVAFLIYIIGKQIRQGIDYLFLVCLSLILAGAMGNILDCLFYGMVFNNPPAPLVAEFVPWGTGYDTIFYGRVVDMFYFPLVEWNWPGWLPFFGGEHFIFFSPIFNFADACISCGVIMVVLFCRNQMQALLK
ncbi:MAG: lipoprotein signal peptidase [Bacteroidaceae bacterium]|jgi:signal peptidase II|nr:lipoprotein signal peptidase [Bacteroidaceae bacterium]MBQ5654752.1 lipoprotein signal peptidase [Bacteroidaceae bacterium]